MALEGTRVSVIGGTAAAEVVLRRDVTEVLERDGWQTRRTRRRTGGRGRGRRRVRPHPRRASGGCGRARWTG